MGDAREDGKDSIAQTNVVEEHLVGIVPRNVMAV